MEHPLIHDRGRGPELLDRRITIYNLVPFFLRAEHTETQIAESFLISAEQVAAMRAYFLDHYADVMAQHDKIEERIRKGYEAQDSPEFRAKVEAGRRSFALYRIWLREECTESKYPDRESKFEAFRVWRAEREAGLVEAVA